MPTHYQGNRRERAALNAYINLVRATETILSNIARDLAARGLTMGQLGVLEALCHLGPMCQKELSEKLLRTGGNVTFVIDRLQRRGWVRRETVESDRRKVLIRLTPGGKQLIERIFPLHLKAILNEFARLDLGEQQTLRRLCRNLGQGSQGKNRAAEFPEIRNATRGAKP
jgi:MarR family 2-MHQ and catechol resistance regulon transcriptional repressor